MKESLFHEGHVNAYCSHHYLLNTSFVLDDDLVIQSYTVHETLFLGYTESELIGMPMEIILCEQSQTSLQTVCNSAFILPTTLEINFITKEQLVVSVSCSIAKLINRSDFIISLVTPIRKDVYDAVVESSKNDKAVRNKKFDAHLIQRLYDYILAHLDDPLPSLKEISRELGTNEYKLKDGFKHFYNSSIYQFYTDSRLKRAYFMIEHTAIPLKNISVMNGYTNYPNFSKSFKKHFGLSPNELKRNEIDFVMPVRY
jgi:AraC-like DNA-binding protein